MAGRVGTKILKLFDPSRDGPPTDRELKDIHDCAWRFLIDASDEKSNLAYLLYQLSKEVIEAREEIVRLLSVESAYESACSAAEDRRFD